MGCCAMSCHAVFFLCVMLYVVVLCQVRSCCVVSCCVVLCCVALCWGLMCPAAVHHAVSWLGLSCMLRGFVMCVESGYVTYRYTMLCYVVRGHGVFWVINRYNLLLCCF